MKKNGKMRTVYGLDHGTFVEITEKKKDPTVSDSPSYLRAMQLAMDLGFSICIPLLVGIFLGIHADRMFHSSPTGTLIGLSLGLVVSGLGVFGQIKRIIRSQ